MTDDDTGGFGTPVPDPLTTLDPHPWYEEMREGRPVWHDESTDLWFLFRYDDVKRAFEDHEVFSAAAWSAFDANRTLPSPTMMDADPPTHGRLRSPVEAPFMPGTVGDHEERIRSIVHERLAAVAGTGPIDFAEEFARPITLQMIMSMLGIPRDDWQHLRDLQAETEHFHRRDDPPTVAEIKRAREATGEMLDYFDRALDGATGSDGLLSLVADAADLSRDEQLSLCMLLFRGGNNNTTNALTNALWVLAEQGLLDTLLAGELDHDLAFDEVLRYRAPLQFMAPRATTTAVEVSGTTIPADEPVALMIESANRDPRQFDRPDEYDPGRKPNKHLSFGSGNHLCLGWALARLEGRVVLDAIADRASDLDVRTDSLDAKASPNSSPRRLPARIDLS